MNNRRYYAWPAWMFPNWPWYIRDLESNEQYPVARDPKTGFWYRFKKYSQVEKMVNKLNKEEGRD